MARDYVEERDGSIYLIESRVPLAHVVYLFQQGDSPEAIRSQFDTLNLEEVYGAITFYLGNKEVVEKDIVDRERVEEEFERTHPMPPELKAKLDRAREQMLAGRT